METIQKTNVLDSVLLSRPIATSLKTLFELYRPECNKYLAKGGYIAPNSSKPLQLADIRIGIDPSTRSLNVFPSILITVSGIQLEWYASKITKENVSVKIFCCVANPVNEQSELLMYDLTDFCRAILISHQVLPFYLEEDDVNGNPYGHLHAPAVATPDISYGNIMANYVKAGQITWNANIMLHHPNLLFGVVDDE